MKKPVDPKVDSVTEATQELRNLHEQSAKARAVLEQLQREVLASTDRFGIHSNLTADLREANERLILATFEAQELQAAAEDAERVKTEFLAMLAHELRNPLAPMRNAVQLLRLQHVTGSTHLTAANIIDGQVSHLVRLVDDLLDVSRISTGKLILRKEPTDLAAVIRKAIEAIRPLCLTRAISLALPSAPLALDADATRLAQVVGNLLHNACKFTKADGTIKLTLAREGDDAVIRIADDGIGIAAEHLTSIFEMFAQVDTTLERAHGGLGIGLALARKVVEMHGGTLAADSAGLHHGAEFIVRLPSLPATHEASVATAVPPATAPRRRILVVDDNHEAADSFAMWLDAVGHETHIAYDGIEAVAMAARLQPDLIFLDLGLPGLNGFDAARRIRDERQDTPVTIVALSGWGQDADRQRSTEAGFDMHMVKPVDFDVMDRLLADLQSRD